jgi:hypothetical protein
MYMTSLIADFGHEIKQINGQITWVQTPIRKRPQPAPMLGYGLIKRPKLGLGWLLNHFNCPIRPGCLRSGARRSDVTTIQHLR